MGSLQDMSDDDLKASYAALKASASTDAQASPLASMSDDDLKARYDRLASPRGTNLPTNHLWTGPDADAFYSAVQPMGRVLSAFGQGAATAWDQGENLGYSDDVNDLMKKAGIYPDVTKGQGGFLRSFNEGLFRPLINNTFGAVGAVARGISSAVAGAQAAVSQGVGEELGMPGLARDLAAGPEAFPLFGAETGGLHGVPVLARADLLAREVKGQLTVPEIDKAAQLGVIGPGGRAAWQDAPMQTMTIHASGLPATMDEGIPVDVNARVKAEQDAAKQAAADGAKPPEQEPQPPTIHDVARQVDPDTFAAYDPLDQQRDQFRQQLQASKDQQRQQVEASAPGQAEITDLQTRMADTTPRLAKKYQARLDALIPERDAWLADDAGMAERMRDTEEQQRMRQQLLNTDYQMRDLAPKVTAAYRTAAQQFPAEAEGAPAAAPEAAPEPSSTPMGNAVPESPAAASAPAAPAPVETPAGPVAPAPAAQPVASPAEAAPAPVDGKAAEVAKPAPAPVASIADDVSRKLVAAGRPQEEADAAAQVTDALWKTRAAAFDGAKGTAEEMYAREAPDVVAGRERTRQPEMAQTTRGKIKLTTDGRSVITLFRDANASTFLHETGHDWLERMMSDASDPAAPAQMKADAAAVRSYLGSDPDKAITTGQHEKFARSFERYFMEGRAPTQALAGVFDKFKGWLTTIYQTVAKLRAPITDDIRDVFNRLLTNVPEKAVIAPEAEDQGRLFDRSPEPANPLYAKVPKEPKRLIQFLRESQTIGNDIHKITIPGGLKDVGGDVNAIIGGAKARPGLINNRTGQNLDDAALRAHEAGYFPEHGSVRPEVNDLLDAIRDDHTGNARYSANDQDAVQAYHDALTQNSEVDRLASEHGIDPAGMTRDQFFDAITDKLSVDEVADEIQSREAARAEEFGDLDAEVRDITDPPWYGIAEPRSLEDLEREDRQANAAGSAEQGTNRAAGSGHAGRSAADGEVGNGQDGRDNGAAGRAGAETGEPGGGGSGNSQSAGPGGSKPLPAAEQPAGPHAPVDEQSDLVDKAGNIRLDNLNEDDDVKQALRDLAAQNDDFMAARGGVISDVEHRGMADALGLTVDGFNAQKPEGVSPSVWTRAVQKLTFQASDQVARLGKAFGDSGSAQDAATYLAAKQRMLLIADHFSSLTAEAGRTLRVFDKAGFKFTGDMVATMERDTGKTLYQMQQEAKAVGALETTAQRSKMIQDMQEPTRWQKVRAGIISYFINNLISGPITHAAYSVGNETWALFKAVPLTLAEATIDEARAAIGGTPLADRVYYGEVGAQIYGMARGMRDGIVPGMKAFKSGISYMKGDIGPQGELGLGTLEARPATIAPALEALKVPASVAGPVGHVLETPSRVVSMIHTIFYSMNYEREIARRAFRAASNEGLTGDGFNTRIAELTSDPPTGMIDAAHNEAMNAVLMKRPSYNSAQQKIVSVVNDSLPLKLAMPFMQIGMNILDEGLIQSTPLGLASQKVRDNLSGRNGDVARSQQYARIGVGSGVVAGVMAMTAQEVLTDGGPSDPKELALKESTGWKPYSLRVGDVYIPYRKYLGPLGPLVAGAANIYGVGHLLSEGELSKAAGAAMMGFSEAILNETWMTGLASFVDAMQHWDRDGEKYVRNLALGFMPFSVGTSQAARLVDQYQREVHSWTDAARNKLPGLSAGLYPQRDWRGEPIASHTMLSTSTDNHDQTAAAMEAAEFYPARVRRDVNGVPLTEQQYDDLSRVAGHLTGMRMDALVKTPGFLQQAAGTQHKMMQQTLESSRKVAEDWLKAQPGNSNIVRQAMAAKAAQMRGDLPAGVRSIRQGATAP